MRPESAESVRHVPVWQRADPGAMGATGATGCDGCNGCGGCDEVRWVDQAAERAAATAFECTVVDRRLGSWPSPPRARLIALQVIPVTPAATGFRRRARRTSPQPQSLTHLHRTRTGHSCRITPLAPFAPIAPVAPIAPIAPDAPIAPAARFGRRHQPRDSGDRVDRNGPGTRQRIFRRAAHGHHQPPRDSGQRVGDGAALDRTNTAGARRNVVDRVRPRDRSRRQRAAVAGRAAARHA